MHDGGGWSGQLTRWVGRLSRVVAVVVPLLATLDRLRRPAGDKFFASAQGGSADLWLPYLGARAIQAHLDPYGPLPAYLQEPSGWPSTYPPTMLALYVPLVWATHANIELACQVFYWINVLALGVLSVVVWRLSLRLVALHRRQASSFLMVLIVLSLNPLTMYAIDRGQSEVVSAALCWGAVLLFVRRQHGWAMIAVTFAGAIKGYAVPLGIGLLIATRGRRQILQGLAGATAVALAVTVPLARYLKHGFESMLTRVDYSFDPVWYNHSFKNTFYQFSPKLADSARRWTLVGLAVVMLFALLRLFLACRKGTPREVTARVVIFAGVALALVIGFPAYAGPYNYVLVLPALVLASTHYEDFYDVLKLRNPIAIPLGMVLVLSLGLALRFRLLDSDGVTLAGIGLVVFAACLGVLTAAAPRRFDAA